jgi:DNA polymerase (family 10)
VRRCCTRQGRRSTWKGNLPKPVTDGLRGILHCHTEGTETPGTMAKATRERGFDYFGVADHSRTAHYAGGLSLEQIAEQHREADRLNRSFGKGFPILKGIESDILADGSLDYPDEILQSFDSVVASIHGRFKLDRKAQTDRLLRAVSNPHTTIVGHMTGRQLQRRPGYDIERRESPARLRQARRGGGDQRPPFGDWTWTGAGTRPRSISAA